MHGALDAATRVAAEFGYLADDALVLQETNNTVVWLKPHEIVAKVGKWAHSADALVREHAVGRALAGSDAPIAPPIVGVRPRRDRLTDFTVTLWQRFEHDGKR